MRVGPFELVRVTEDDANGHQLQDPESTPNFGERGSSGMSKYRSLLFGDYNPQLSGRTAIDTYDKMRKGDSSVRTSLRIIKAPLLAAEWYVQPASPSDEHRLHAEFVQWAFDSMSRTMVQYLWESLLMLDFGYYIFEKVFENATWRPGYDRARERPVVKWKKFGPRHPRSILDWEFDSNGGVNRVQQDRQTDGKFDPVWLKIEDLLIFTFDEEANDPTGTSVLRSAYKHWYYKENLYKVDAIQKERHGIGIPKGTPPPNATATDIRLLDEALRNLRTNEKAFVNLPTGFDISFLELSGNPVNPLDSAQHHDWMIMKNVMGQFLDLGQAESGSRAVGGVQSDMFVKAIRYVADIIRSVFNKWAIPQLVNYNFDTDVYPQLRVRRIGENADFRALSVAIRNFVETQVITPDPEFEKWMRDYMDLPIPSQDALDRDVAARTEKKTGDYTNRVPMPADGGEGVTGGR